MRELFHFVSNRAAALFMKLLFGYSSRIYVTGRDNAERAGGFLLASNHISHFDPFIISSVVRRKIDWMAMAEFFPLPVVGLFLCAVDAFPAERNRADRATIRTAIERLTKGRIVGLFPEGGIRDGANSLLQGAPTRAGVSALAHIAGVPILPCVILGSDRLYALRRWLPLRRRSAVWIGFGHPISNFQQLKKAAAREHIERELTAAFQRIYAELREKFQLTADDLPHPPRERMKKAVLHHEGHEGREAKLDEKNSATLRDLRVRRRGIFRRTTASVIDLAMCTAMNLLQSRHRLNGQSVAEMERYVAEYEQLTPGEYYAVPSGSRRIDLAGKLGNGNTATVTWRSPIETEFSSNDVARADFFWCSAGRSAPTVFMLHALMSATHIGYRRWAKRFNQLGWNACFVHLPYHYSRAPRGYWNGELAITADLIRNAEGLRQGVIEVRQLIAALQALGCDQFGLLGTSYGGWIGALLAMVERDLRFVALMCPIVNVEHAIWQNPGTAFMRRELRRARTPPELVARHFHLSSPSHNQPVCDPSRILFASGDFDLIARPEDIEAIQQKWRGSELLRIPQGHFGYRMMRETMAHLKTRRLYGDSK